MKVIYNRPTRYVGRERLARGSLCTVTEIWTPGGLGPVFILSGMPKNAKGKPYTFAAAHFIAENGKSAGVVQAVPNSVAFAALGERPLYLTNYEVIDGAEYVQCRDCESMVGMNAWIAYNLFRHTD